MLPLRAHDLRRVWKRREPYSWVCVVRRWDGRKVKLTLVPVDAFLQYREE